MNTHVVGATPNSELSRYSSRLPISVHYAYVILLFSMMKTFHDIFDMSAFFIIGCRIVQHCNPNPFLSQLFTIIYLITTWKFLSLRLGLIGQSHLAAIHMMHGQQEVKQQQLSSVLPTYALCQEGSCGHSPILDTMLAIASKPEAIKHDVVGRERTSSLSILSQLEMQFHSMLIIIINCECFVRQDRKTSQFIIIAIAS